MDKRQSTRLPLYVRISELLHREIAAGHWIAGERLPAESVLAQDLDVAVGTLRKALDVLEKEGLLERRQGSGTYVRKPPEGGAIYQFFRLELLDGGGMPTATTLSVDKLVETGIAEIFSQSNAGAGAGASAKVADFWRVRRLRFLNRCLLYTSPSPRD